MIELVFGSGDPLYVNPAHVVFVQNVNGEPGFSTIVLADGTGTWWRVRGYAHDVIRQLAGQ